LSALRSAFEAPNIRAVAVTVNSPGGSPVQSDLIHKRIRTLAERKKLPVYVFVEEMAASAGYHIATAGNEIYAHEQSLVGSIGVVTMQFGVTKLLNTIGVEPRIMHKGENKVWS
jgi:serine protease SohB